MRAEGCRDAPSLSRAENAALKSAPCHCLNHCFWVVNVLKINWWEAGIEASRWDLWDPLWLWLSPYGWLYWFLFSLLSSSTWSNLMQKGFVWPQLQGYRPLWWRRHEGRGQRHPLPLHVWSGSGGHSTTLPRPIPRSLLLPETVHLYKVLQLFKVVSPAGDSVYELWSPSGHITFQLQHWLTLPFSLSKNWQKGNESTMGKLALNFVSLSEQILIFEPLLA